MEYDVPDEYGVVTYIDCRLSEKGKGVYKKIEEAYRQFIDSVKSDFL